MKANFFRAGQIFSGSLQRKPFLIIPDKYSSRQTKLYKKYEALKKFPVHEFFFQSKLAAGIFFPCGRCTACPIFFWKNSLAGIFLGGLPTPPPPLLCSLTSITRTHHQIITGCFYHVHERLNCAMKINGRVIK